jgi:hypothetical protein
MQHRKSIAQLSNETRIPQEFLVRLERGEIDCYAALTDWQYAALGEALNVSAPGLILHARRAS